MAPRKSARGYGHYEAWTGTPNSMGGKLTKDGKIKPLSSGSLASVKKSTHGFLDTMKKQAGRFDHAAEQKIIWVTQELNSIHDGSMQVGTVRSWQWTQLGMEVRIEIRRTL